MEKITKSVMKWQKIREHIWHLPGHNPSGPSLCGTNCYILGAGTERMLVETGEYPGANEQFIGNLKEFI